jgi:hypothetical protein
MNKAAFFTLQIITPGTKIAETKTIELNNLSYDDALKRMTTLYTQGISIETSPKCRELISPFRINTAFLIEQAGKI